MKTAFLDRDGTITDHCDMDYPCADKEAEYTLYILYVL